MNNKELLNEGFFSNKKQKQKYPTYTPMDKNKTTDTGFGAVDTKNVKQLGDRLQKVIGATLGNSTIKNMSNRAIKTFPIIVSDNVDPTTAVMLKNYLEQQYAEYLNLIISNQIIDITDYDRDNSDGNIAIQALNNITGSDFSKQRIANRAASGKLTTDDVFSNDPLYKMLKQESFKSGDPNVDTILENAIIVNSVNEDKVISTLIENANTLLEFPVIHDPIPPKNPTRRELHDPIPPENPTRREPHEHEKNKGGIFGYTYKNNGVYNTDDIATFKNTSDELTNMMNQSFLGRNDRRNSYPGSYSQRAALVMKQADPKTREDLARRGYNYTDKDGFEHYDKLTNTEILIDPDLLQNAINKSVGEFLHDHQDIADRFKTATWLLNSRIIAGTEYASYVSQRLGIPIRKEVYADIIKKYPAKNLIDYDHGQSHIKSSTANSITGGYVVYNATDYALSQQTAKIVRNITKVSIKDCLTWGGVGAAAGGAVGIGSAISLIALGVVTPWLAAPVAASVAGGAGIGVLLAKHKKKKALVDMNNPKGIAVGHYKPWERVESLVEDMIERQNYFVAHMKNEKSAKNDILNPKNLSLNKEIEFKKGGRGDAAADFKIYEDSVNNAFKDFNAKLNKIFAESITMYNIFDEFVPLEESFKDTNQDILEAYSECYGIDSDLLEAKMNRISLTTPADIKAARKQMPLTVLQYNPDDTFMVPSYGTKSVQAYGSVEYDKRELKDRKFNTPLLMTVRFKERYSDGKYSDNELTAVIGILGVVTRVPSEEMEYILKSNAQGATIKGIFSADGTSSLGDLLASFKGSNIDVSKLPQSADVWKNLEKVSHLAVANALSGRANNNVANAHIIFSQKEADAVRQELGIDYLRDKKLSAALMKRYSAMNLMIANDSLDRVFVFNDIDSSSWDVIPYDAIRGRDSSDLAATLQRNLR